MKSIILTIAFLFAGSTFAASDSCVVSPSGTLLTQGKKTSYDWSKRADLRDAFQNIGYTVGDIEMVDGGKGANISLACDSSHGQEPVSYACHASVVIYQKKGGELSAISKAHAAKLGTSLDQAILNAVSTAISYSQGCQ